VEILVLKVPGLVENGGILVEIRWQIDEKIGRQVLMRLQNGLVNLRVKKAGRKTGGRLFVPALIRE
jgi:hypothetical protein